MSERQPYAERRTLATRRAMVAAFRSGVAVAEIARIHGVSVKAAHNTIDTSRGFDVSGPASGVCPCCLGKRRFVRWGYGIKVIPCGLCQPKASVA